MDNFGKNHRNSAKSELILGVTATEPLVEGSFRVTEEILDELIVAFTLVSLVVPLESVPAGVENRMPAPPAEPPDWL
jgi:hypothetical protein